MDLSSNEEYYILVSTPSSSPDQPVEDVQPVYHSSAEGIHRVELCTHASRDDLLLLLLLVVLLFLLQVMVGVVGGKGDAVRERVGVGVKLTGVEGRKVSGQALPCQQGDVAEQLVDLKTSSSKVRVVVLVVVREYNIYRKKFLKLVIIGSEKNSTNKNNNNL